MDLCADDNFKKSLFLSKLDDLIFKNVDSKRTYFYKVLLIVLLSIICLISFILLNLCLIHSKQLFRITECSNSTSNLDKVSIFF